MGRDALCRDRPRAGRHQRTFANQRNVVDVSGQRSRDVLWHVIQFYLTGAAVQDVLAARGIAYTPYMYSSGLIDRAWSRYRKPVEEN